MNTPIDLDDLIERIRREAASDTFAPRTALSPEILGGNTTTVSPGTISSSASPSVSETITCTDIDQLLLLADDDGFTAAAYRSVLGREPDPIGIDHFQALRKAGRTRIYRIAQLLASAERRQRSTPLAGKGLALPAYYAIKLCEKLRLTPLARLLETGYHHWRTLQLHLRGRSIAQLAKRQDQLLEQLNDLQRSFDQAWRTQQQSSSATQAQINELGHNTQQQLDELGSSLRQALEEASQHHRQALETQTLALRTQIDEQSRALNLLRARTNILQQRLLPADGQRSANLPPAAPSDLDARITAYYLAFEEAHRGSEAEIRAKLGVYLDHIATLPPALLTLPMLDLGCGRGEWLGLLGEQGFDITGIDLNADMVDHCRRHGLKAEHANALDWLAAQPDHSHALISAFHLVEHLPFEVLFPLIEQAARVLAPGGLLIVETPNPENVLVGSHTFYHDFSHRNPVTPSALQFLLGYHGLDAGRILRLNPYPPEARVAEHSLTAERVNGHFCGPQDFAVIARKPLADAELRA